MNSLSICFPLLVFVLFIQQAAFAASVLNPEDITFYLWTPGGESPEPHVVKVGEWQSFQEASFDSSKKTEVYIHGWRNNGTDTIAEHFARAFLKAGDSNVIIVDWSTLSMTMDFLGSVENIPVLGNRTAEMIETLEENGFPLDKVHLSGHGTSAHAAGVAGTKIQTDLKKSLSRITGLDPAGGHPINMQYKHRLDKSNGKFVDVIHTNAGDGKKQAIAAGLHGFLAPLGHADYYPNGGQRQPGCTIATDHLLTGLCSHLKSIVYFVNSVNNDIYKSCPCDNYRKAVAKRCSTNCRDPVSMGEPAVKSSSGIFYLVPSQTDFIDN